MEERYVELESKVTFLERLVDRLNDVLLEQQRQIDGLSHALKHLHEQMDSPQDSMPANEKPPHY